MKSTSYWRVRDRRVSDLLLVAAWLLFLASLPARAVRGSELMATMHGWQALLACFYVVFSHFPESVMLLLFWVPNLLMLASPFLAPRLARAVMWWWLATCAAAIVIVSWSLAVSDRAPLLGHWLWAASIACLCIWSAIQRRYPRDVPAAS